MRCVNGGSKRPALLVFLLLFIVPTASATTILHGRIVRVIDGDSLVLLDASHTQHEIRLAEIDAPEHGQPYGKRAKQSLAKMAFGRAALAECPVRDQYGRSVCRVTVDKVDVNLEQVRLGMAWAYTQYATDPRIYQAEKKARAAKKGLWAGAHPVPPWVWRHKRRAGRFDPPHRHTLNNSANGGSKRPALR